MIRQSFITICTLLILATYSTAEEEIRHPLNSALEAAQAACLFTGFKSIANIDNIDTTLFHIVTMVDQSTPFLSDSITGRKAWEITFNDLDMPSYNAKENPGSSEKKDFFIYIDVETGRLLKLIGLSDSSKKDIPKDLDAREYEKRTGSLEKCAGFPFKYPNVNFNEILGNSDGVMSKHIDCSKMTAVYNTYCLPSADSLPQPAWIITFQGLPRGGYGTTIWRIIVSSEDGKYLLGSMWPFE